MPLPIRRPAPAFAPAAVCLTMPHIAHAIVALVCSLVTMAVMFVLSAGNFEFRCACAEAERRRQHPPAAHACGRTSSCSHRTFFSSLYRLLLSASPLCWPA